MLEKALPVVDTSEYQESIDGDITVSSEALDFEGAYVSWHTQPQQSSESIRPPTCDHQFVLYCSEEEKGEYRYNDGQWQRYTKHRNEWFIAPAYENQIRWRWHQIDTLGIVCRFHIAPKLLERAASLHLDCPVHNVALQHQMNIYDAFLTNIAFELRDELLRARRHRHSARYGRCLINTFAYRVIKAYGSSSCVNGLPAGSSFGEGRRLRIEEFIEQNLQSHLTTEALAKVVWMSKYHFCRVFKATFGATPQRYVQRRRIAHASKLLHETDIPITQIALMSGLSPNGGFSRTFKAYTGQSPREFRQSGYS